MAHIGLLGILQGRARNTWGFCNCGHVGVGLYKLVSKCASKHTDIHLLRTTQEGFDSNDAGVG